MLVLTDGGLDADMRTHQILMARFFFKIVNSDFQVLFSLSLSPISLHFFLLSSRKFDQPILFILS